MNLKSTDEMQLREISANILHNKARREWKEEGGRGVHWIGGFAGFIQPYEYGFTVVVLLQQHTEKRR